MRRVFLEWCVIVAVLLSLSAWLSMGREDSVTGRLASVDAGFYDLINRLQPLAPSDDLAIIEIDEASIAQIGRWPWPRGVHAALLDRLTAGGAAVIGLDILIAESGLDDEVLAGAIERAPIVVLPVASDNDFEGRAWPIYPVYVAGLVSRLGHAHFSFDVDGVVRGFYLAEGGNPAFALTALLASGVSPPQALVQQALTSATQSERDRTISEGIWERREFALLPSSGKVAMRYSYAQVLRGEADLTGLPGKTVLIGATATGMRDAYSSSLLADETVAAGVDLHASAFNAIARDRLAQRLPFMWHLLVIAITIIATMMVLYASSPRRGLAAVMLAALLVALASLAGLRLGWWMPPGGTIAGVLLAYPLWSWRRLESVIAGLIEQARTLETEPEVLAIVRDGVGGASPSQRQTVKAAGRSSGERVRANALAFAQQAGTPADADETVQTRGFLGRLRPPVEPVTMELGSLQRAAVRINALRLLLITAVERLPHAALVCGAGGHMIIRNRLARDSFMALEAGEGMSAWQWLDDEFGVETRHRVRNTAQGGDAQALEVQDKAGRDWLMDARHVDTDGLPVLWLIQFTDITRMREMQREREEMMHFISHDLRSPQVSIIGALDQIPPAQQSEWTEAIRHAARHSMALAESFIQWTRAENKPFERSDIDLADLVTEAVDAAWPISKGRNIPVVLSAPERAPAMGDAQLIRRALGNLIDNAFKYGGDVNTITVTLKKDGPNWTITVADEGPGLGDIDPQRLFDAYRRGSAPNDQLGTGLGLALVRMVAVRHGGDAQALSRPGRGACFCMTFPAQT